MFIPKEFFVDKRVVKRNIAHGRLSAQDFQQQLTQLPDLEEQCERFTAESMLPEHLRKSEISVDTSSAE